MLQVARNLFLHLGKYLEVVSVIDSSSLHAACVRLACGHPVSTILKHAPLSKPSSADHHNQPPSAAARSHASDTAIHVARPLHKQITEKIPQTFRRHSTMLGIPETADRGYSSYRLMMVEAGKAALATSSNDAEPSSTAVLRNKPPSSQPQPMSGSHYRLDRDDSSLSNYSSKRRYFRDLCSDIIIKEQSSEEDLSPGSPPSLPVEPSSTEELVRKQQAADTGSSGSSDDVHNRAFLLLHSDMDTATSTESGEHWYRREDLCGSPVSCRSVDKGRSVLSVDADHMSDLNSTFTALPSQAPTVSHVATGMTCWLPFLFWFS